MPRQNAPDTPAPSAPAADPRASSTRLVPADAHDVIRVRGARVNNLRGVDVDLPKRRLTVVTGVSGSGKSSLVFGTIAAESRRLIDETYPAFVQSFMTGRPRPDVDELANLTPAIVLDQERLGGDVRSTVGTASDAYTLLRTLFSRCSSPHVGGPQAFAFTVASARGGGVMQVGGVSRRRTFEVIGGMCPTCEGTGRTSALDIDVMVDRSKSLNEGAILLPGHPVGSWMWRAYAESEKLDPDLPLADYTPEQWHWLIDQEPTKVRFSGINYTYQGLASRVRSSYLSTENPPKQKHIQAFARRVATFAPCPDCGGTRLAEAARTAQVDGATIAELTALQVSELRDWVRARDLPEVAPLLRRLEEILDAIIGIGLGYLSLDRGAGTLSGGEAQRLRMVRHLGSALTDVTYVFDEPTVGLHPHDISRMNRLLLALRDTGSTVLVVEHKPEVMEIADLVVDLGPGAGADGGTVCYIGDLAGLRAAGTATARALAHRTGLRESTRPGTGTLEIRGARTHNLRDVDVDIPLGALTVLTGVAGSGKSSLMHGSLAPREDVLLVDQSGITGSRRSNPATYTGLLDPIRAAFAAANDVPAALFSFNSEGACPQCKGAGVITTDLGPMSTVETPCEVCGGLRFQPEVLEHLLDGRSIVDVLDLSVAEAAEALPTGSAPAAGRRKMRTILRALLDVGLGYLRLGQPLSTLSGGERQRIKLAARLAAGSAKGAIIVLDEPTTGLHLQDIDALLAMLHGLVEAGATVIVVEHSLAVMAQADHLIDLGPGAGHEGGRVVYAGTPRAMVEDPGVTTLTAQALRRWLR